MSSVDMIVFDGKGMVGRMILDDIDFILNSRNISGFGTNYRKNLCWKGHF